VCYLRDKHFAHSVNSFEDNVITVSIGEHFNSSEEIETVGVSQTWSGGLSIGHPAQLKRLAQWWLVNTDTELAAERAKVLQIARATPLSDLKALGVPKPEQPRVTGAVARRRKHP
jgi:hypothetical protein